ncbi:hypothetical protein ELG94_01165 [Rhizobium ruizarguesonis]|uniref:Uncharacterized protein n=1 Tax=Rhizobium ruizarguesonis TaxID=2081791 RepID=A0AAE8Q9E1_9HYPH|nr:hypothetical protein ELG94_01165 [Rhizobium ruizarguesonis]
MAIFWPSARAGEAAGRAAPSRATRIGAALAGGRGTERSRHIPFAPLAGRRWRQPDEGRTAAAVLSFWGLV